MHVHPEVRSRRGEGKGAVTGERDLPAGGADSAARQAAALDAVEEMACAPAQPSLLLELCVERARGLVRAGGAAVQLLEGGDGPDDPGELLFAATSGMLRDQLGTLQSVHGTLCGTAVRRGEVVRTADAQLDPRGDRSMARSLGIHGAVSLPLRQHQRSIGVLLVVSERADAFADEDVLLLRRLARVASGRLDYALARDARRRTEEALSASRQKYRTVLASVEQGILVLDEYDRVTMVNPAAERILGEPAYELMRKPPAWVLQREDGAPLPREERPSAIALREQRAAAADMLRLVRSDGRVRWVSATVSPLPPAEDGRRSVVVCFSDVTAQRGAAERMTRSERLLAETQRLAHVGSWDWEAPGPAERLTWTDEMYRLAGLVPQSVMVTGKLWRDVTHPGDRERMDATLREAFDRGGPFELSQRMVLPTGEVRHLSIRGEVEPAADGRPARAWGSAQDVTERHRVQEELRRTALTDPLTGLGNRLLLVDRLQPGRRRPRRRRRRQDRCRRLRRGDRGRPGRPQAGERHARARDRRRAAAGDGPPAAVGGARAGPGRPARRGRVRAALPGRRPGRRHQAGGADRGRDQLAVLAARRGDRLVRARASGSP